jgi:nucleotidyltransferase/DNA polymerase involved in DNA repair
MLRRARPSIGRQALVMITIALAALLTGCGDNGADTEATGDTVEEAATDARQEAEDAFASLRTDAERLIDELQTRNAPEIKQQLLDRCRDALQRLRQAGSDQTDRVDDLCNRIREVDPNDDAMWSEVRQQLMELTSS